MADIKYTAAPEALTGKAERTKMIDLHMHSSFSNDGEFSPSELVEKCFDNKAAVISITDHNCARANEEALAAAARKGILYIPGIEIDCVYKGINFHMLGYGIDHNSRDFIAVENDIRRQGLDVSLRTLEKTQAMGFHITENDMRNMSQNSYWPEVWTGEMFAEALLSDPEYAHHPLLSPYREGGERSDNPYVNFYWDFYSQGKDCYVEMRFPEMSGIVDLIRQNQGAAVLAHPGVNLKDRRHLLKEIIDLGIDGIEAFSSYHSPAQSLHCYKQAKEHLLFVTCGSDFHGKTKPAIHIGKHGCFLPENEMREQLERLL